MVDSLARLVEAEDRRAHATPSTLPFLEAYRARDARVVPTRNTYGRGPAHAIHYGIDHAGS